MLYIILGLFIVYLFEVYDNYSLEKKLQNEIHWKDILNIFNDMDLLSYLIFSIFASTLIFILLVNIDGVANTDYDKPMSATYELKEINEKQYFKRKISKPSNDTLVDLLLINDDGMLTHETFNENEDNIKYQLKDGKASVTIQKQNKIEPSTFEKVWYLKGILGEEEKIHSVVITIPEDSNYEL